MTIFNFVSNYLEPVANAIYLVALLIYCYLHSWKSNRFLLLYYGIATVLMLLASLLVGHQNIWLYNTVSTCAQILIGLHFYHILEGRTKKLVVLSFITIYIIYAFIKNIVLHDTGIFDSIGYSMVSASISIIVFMYFHQVLKYVTEVDILSQFNFWLASGYLIYFVGSFIIFISYSYLTAKILTTYTKSERALMTALWGGHNVLLFISALSLLIGSLWVTYRKRSA